nr:A-kinase anchor protein 12-like [Paramormyrops kingsleyae]
MDITALQREDCVESGQEEEAEHPKVEKEEKQSPDVRKPLTEAKAEGNAGQVNAVGLRKRFWCVGHKFALKKKQSEKAEALKQEESNSSKILEEDANIEEVKDVKTLQDLEENGMGAESMTDLPLVKVSGEVPDVPGAVGTTRPTEEVILQTDLRTELSTRPPQDVEFPLKIFTHGILSGFGMKVVSTQPVEEKSFERVLLAVEDEPRESEESAELPRGSEKSIETMVEIQKEEGAISGVIPQTAELPEERLYEDEIKEEIAIEANGSQTVLEQGEDALVAEISSTEYEDDDDEEESNSEEESPVMSFEAELFSSLEKKLHNLFIGNCRKRFPTKKQANKEDEIQSAGDGEPISEELQSPEKSTEGSAEWSVQMEDAAETDEDANVLVNEERKNNGKLPWSLLKKLFTPKKQVRRSSESDGEGPNLIFNKEEEEQKPSEANQETELDKKKPTKKIHSSVSWETLLCLRSAKKSAITEAQELASKHEIEGSSKVYSDAPPEEQKEINDKGVPMLSGELPENDETSKDYKRVLTTETVLQEVVENVSLMLDALLVTTADEQQESTTLPVIPQILDPSTKEDKTVLLARKNTDAIAICRHLQSNNFELVEEVQLRTAESAVTKNNKENSELTQIVDDVPETEIKGLHEVAPAQGALEEEELARLFETLHTEDITKHEANEELVFGQSAQTTEVSITAGEKHEKPEDIKESTDLDAPIIDIKSDF